MFLLSYFLHSVLLFKDLSMLTHVAIGHSFSLLYNPLFDYSTTYLSFLLMIAIRLFPPFPFFCYNETTLLMNILIHVHKFARGYCWPVGKALSTQAKCFLVRSYQHALRQPWVSITVALRSCHHSVLDDFNICLLSECVDFFSWWLQFSFS